MRNKPLHILIVEDDQALQDVYTLIFSSQGYKVSTANNGILAFKELHSEAPDIILLDYFMPVMDGKTFLMNYNAADYPNTKVVVATNVSEQKTLDEMITLGAHSYVLKSKLSPNEMIDFIESVAGE